MIARLGLLVAVVALGAVVLVVGFGGLRFVAAGIGSTVGGFVTNVTSTPSAKASIAILTDAPTLKQPREPYTTSKTVDLVVTVPEAQEGDPSHRIRVYLQLADQNPTAIKEVPIADAPTTIVPVDLSDGANDFTVTIVGAGGESDPSLSVRYVLDNAPPKITITSPKNNAIVNRKAVEIKGKTQARTTLLARNAANGSSIVGTAESDGSFKLSLALAGGVNKITIDATDPAGNESTATLNVKRGTGKLSVTLSASPYQIKRSKLPETVTLTAIVTDPDGKSIEGADVTFTLSLPGVTTLTSDTKTNGEGRATFKTTIPKGADLGQGSATVLVSTSEFGSTEDFTVISIVK